MTTERLKPINVEVRDNNCNLLGYVIMDDTPKCGSTVQMEPGVVFEYRGYHRPGKPTLFPLDHNAHALRIVKGHENLTKIPGFFTEAEAISWLK